MWPKKCVSLPISQGSDIQWIIERLIKRVRASERFYGSCETQPGWPRSILVGRKHVRNVVSSPKEKLAQHAWISCNRHRLTTLLQTNIWGQKQKQKKDDKSRSVHCGHPLMLSICVFVLQVCRQKCVCFVFFQSWLTRGRLFMRIYCIDLSFVARFDTRDSEPQTSCHCDRLNRPYKSRHE